MISVVVGENGNEMGLNKKQVENKGSGGNNQAAREDRVTGE